jgi:hypothetical protein
MADLIRWLTNHSQGRFEAFRKLEIVKANQGQVGGYSHFHFGACTQQIASGQSIHREGCSGGLAAPQ